MPDFLSFRTCLIVSGTRMGLRPNFTPRSWALAIPSICRSRRMSFSNSAIRARMPITGIIRLTNHELADYNRSRLSRCELTPFRECGSTVLLEDVAAVDMAAVVEVVVD